MRRADLAEHLIKAETADERRRLIRDNPKLADEALASELREICYASWTAKPVKAQRAAAAIGTLSKFNKSEEIRGIAAWVAGIAEITKGRFERAVSSLEKASEILAGLGRKNDGAQADVARLLALAMLGRYEEAIATAEGALQIFAAAADDLAVGKIEMNLSNIVSRQALHHEAEKYCLSARRHFIKAKEKSWQAMAENGLANTYAELNDFAAASKFYRSALATAKNEKMGVTEAEIEASLGNLETLRGRYQPALRYLESSRQKYADLDMPHQSAIADLEIADIYKDLNLLEEAAAIYERVSSEFLKLKMRGEEARSRLNCGQTAAKLARNRLAVTELKRSRILFEAEKNVSGQVSALLALAELSLSESGSRVAASNLNAAAALIGRDDNPRHIIDLQLLEGRLFAKQGRNKLALSSLEKAAAAALKFKQPDSLQKALNLLGEVSAANGDPKAARRYFYKAIELIEEMRSGIGADEFSMSFLASRIDSFENLAALLLDEGRIVNAFEIIERGRSRALLHAIDARRPRSTGSRKLGERESELRARLNSAYKQLEHASGDEVATLRPIIRTTESTIAEIARQIESLSPAARDRKAGKDKFTCGSLRQRLGNSATLIEFIERDGEIAAFVVTGRRIRFVSDLGRMSDVTALLEDLHFQFGALRYGSQLSRFAGQLKGRTDACLVSLYDILLRPLKKFISAERLVFVPAGALNYVPFHALYDGKRYVAESFETSSAPSAAVWEKLQSKTKRKQSGALLIGYADERIPLVENEIREIAAILPYAKTLTGRRATFSSFIDNASTAGLLHLACHGQFRPDNPMFSSLHLADGWVTVRDICAQSMKAGLVTLSACETGMSKVFAGDEILGLARGFLSAGALSIIVSLWTVNDAATSRLMQSFYTFLQRGGSPAASLRQAQLESIERGEHPYLWSPFVLIGK